MNKSRDVIYTTPKKGDSHNFNTFNENETEKTDSHKSSSNGFSDEIKSETTEIIELKQKRHIEEKKKNKSLIFCFILLVNFITFISKFC
jgi:hypothetical protein